LGDVAHDESSGLFAWDSGWWDESLAAKGTNSMAYFTREDLPYYYALADAYTICDEYHCQPSHFPVNALHWFSQYLSASPGNPLYDRGIALVPDVVGAFQSDVSNGTLPSVSWILPGASRSEHPCYSPASGAMLTKQFLDALASNPEVCNSTVFFLTYDENGGFL
jgi:phospholipase C